MRRINFAFAAALAVAGMATTVQAREAAAQPATGANAASGQTQGVQKGSKSGLRHLHRAGTATAGSDSFLPVFGNLVASTFISSTVTAAVVDNRNPASPD